MTDETTTDDARAFHRSIGLFSATASAMRQALAIQTWA